MPRKFWAIMLTKWAIIVGLGVAAKRILKDDN